MIFCGKSFGSTSRVTLGVSVGIILEILEMILWAELEDVVGGDSGIICGVTLEVCVELIMRVTGVVFGVRGDDLRQL